MEVAAMPGVNEERVVREFIDLVKIYSPSLQERDVAVVLEAELKRLGLDVVNDGTGEGNTGNLIATLKGDGRGVPIYLSAHMDTVEPGKGISPVIKSGVIQSDGTTILGADCKASIAAIFEAIRVVRQDNIPHGDVEVLISYGEEKGLMGAKTLDHTRLRAKYGFVADSSNPPGTIILSAPSQDTISVVFHGRSAHAGLEPEKGIDALRAAALAITRMPLGRIDDETTANIGLIKGGLGRNSVPDRIEMEGEARSRNNEKLARQTRAMVEAMESAAADLEATVDIKISRQYDTYRFEEDAPIVQMAKEAAEAAGLKTGFDVSGGGTDGNILNARGVTSLVLGTGMMQPHSVDEEISIADIVGLTRLMVELIRKAAQM
jgi:tripeptide aminopeptidase